MRAIFIGFLISVGVINAQRIDTTGKNDPSLSTVIEYQKNLNKEYANSETSPLDSADLVKFSSLNFFSPGKEYVVTATFEKRKKMKKFKMKTSTDRKPEYVIYGEVHFILKGISFKLSVYQNVELSKKPGFEKYLFLPFTDLTNGETTYGGGRYIDLKIPDGKELVIDFNQAYNPYCAYAHRYSCPIPPAENFLNIKVEAGVKEGLIYQ
jgi:uncharacterized protein (DUF1684 family)